MSGTCDEAKLYVLLPERGSKIIQQFQEPSPTHSLPIKSLVLDKSALQAAPKGFIASLKNRFKFILIEALGCEIMSEGDDKRDMLSEIDLSRLDDRIRANYQKAIVEAGNKWLCRKTAFEWEVTKAESARSAPRDPLERLEDVMRLSPEAIAECVRYDESLGEIVNQGRHALLGEDREMIVKLRGNSKRFFEWLTACLNDPDLIDYIKRRAITNNFSSSKASGLEMSTGFYPDRDWITFGSELAFQCLVYYETWRDHATPRKVSKLTNQFFDIEYLAYMAMADGLFSGDKYLLKLAWACWPDKREGLYEYVQGEKTMRIFTPKWSKEQ